MSKTQAVGTRKPSLREIEAFVSIFPRSLSQRCENVDEEIAKIRAGVAELGASNYADDSVIFSGVLKRAKGLSRTQRDQVFVEIEYQIPDEIKPSVISNERTCIFETSSGAVIGIKTEVLDKAQYYLSLGEAWKNEDRRPHVMFYAPYLNSDDVQFLKKAGHKVARNGKELAELVGPTLSGSVLTRFRERAEQAERYGESFKKAVELVKAGKDAFEWLPEGARKIAINSLTLLMGIAVGLVSHHDEAKVGKKLSSGGHPEGTLEYQNEAAPPIFMTEEETRLLEVTRQTIDEFTKKRLKKEAIAHAESNKATKFHKRAAGIGH